MKYLFNYFIAILIIGSFVSCEDIGTGVLEMPESSDVTIDTMFSSLEYAERVLWYSYGSLPSGFTRRSGGANSYSGNVGGSVLESLTDLAHNYMTWTGAVTTYYSGAYNAVKAGENNWNSPDVIMNFFDIPNRRVIHWRAIRNCHIFMNNIDKVPDVDPAYRNRLVAEAKMIMALQYYELFKNYGGMIWISKVYNPEDDFKIKRLTAKATVDSINSLIDQAIPDLPWTISQEEFSNWSGRFTQAGAMGLKTRLALFAASPLFNSEQPYLAGEAADEKLTWYGGYDQTMWQKAADAAKALIDKIDAQGGYALEQAAGNTSADYRAAFRKAYYERSSSELLISTRDAYNSPPRWDGNYYDITFNYGDGKPTMEYMRKFPMADGTPVDDPASGWSATVDPWGTEGANPSYNRDPRLYETVLINGDRWAGRTAELYLIPNSTKKGREMKLADVSSSARKFFPEANEAGRPGHHWPYLRLPEIYLAYAEAMNELGDQATAKEYLNKIRNRVGLKNIEEVKASWTKEELRNEILDERAREFGFENIRWYDIVRWKMEEAFTQTLHKPLVYKSGKVYTYEYPEIDANFPRYWTTHFSPKWYLSAFPSDEVNKQYGLVQNPGW